MIHLQVGSSQLSCRHLIASSSPAILMCACVDKFRINSRGRRTSRFSTRQTMRGPPPPSATTGLATDVQARLDAAYPPVANLSTLYAPRLTVRAAHTSALPKCAAQGEPTFWVHLAGHYRSFGARVGNLVAFLNGASSCWFVVLLTLDVIETQAPHYCSKSGMTPAKRHECLELAASSTNQTSVAEQLADSVRALWSQPTGGCAYAVVSRGHTPFMGDTAILQNFAAAAALARAIIEWQGVATRPWDVILQSRPDVVFAAAVDVPRLHQLFRSAHLASSHHEPVRAGAASGALLLLIRHSDHEFIGWNDPSEVAWFASRAAYDRLCPSGMGCLGARRALDVKAFARDHGGGSCGHPYVSLFVHAARHARVATFFVPVGWRVQLQRLGGDRARGFNGHDGLAADERLLTRRYDLTSGLRCVTGHDETTNASACRRDAALEARTPWGAAKLTTALSYGARFYVCNEPLQLADVVRQYAPNGRP